MLIQLERAEYVDMRQQMMKKLSSYNNGLGNLYPFRDKRDWQLGLVKLRDSYNKPCKATASNVQFLEA